MRTMKDIPFLSSAEVPIFQDVLTGHSTLAEESPSAADKPAAIAKVRDTVLPWRLALWTILFLLAGFGMGYATIPLLRASDLSGLITAHLPKAETAFASFFLRLCLHNLPVLLLLAAAGLTGFSNTLITVTSGLCGIADGATVALLWFRAWSVSSEGALLVNKTLFGCFLIMVILKSGIRWFLSVSARRTAIGYFHAQNETPAHTFLCVMKHLRLILLGSLLTVLLCFSYALCLFVLV